MTIRHAACSCGQLTADCEGEPLRISVCHCYACQQRTGSAFGVQARWPRTAVTLDGTASAYVRTGDSGGQVTFHFCPTCGSTVYYLLNGYPDQIAVPVGAFADSNFPAPKFSVYEERKHAWVDVTGEMERYD